MEFQKTIKRKISCSGIGLHSGKPVNLRMLPAGEDTGVVFRRVDLGGAEIRANQEFITQVHYATSISNGKLKLFTVEHLLSALYGMGVNNIVIEMDSDEVPILDGSALPFVEMLQEAEIVRLNRANCFLQILEPIEVREGRSFHGSLSIGSFRNQLHDQLSASLAEEAGKNNADHEGKFCEASCASKNLRVSTRN